MRKKTAKLSAVVLTALLSFGLFSSAALADDAASGDAQELAAETTEGSVVSEPETDVSESEGKELRVDANADTAEGSSYQTIQAAVDYISGLADGTGAEDGWWVEVISGTYAGFEVPAGVDNLTIFGGDGDVIDVGNDGISVAGNNFTLQQFTVIGAGSDKSGSYGISVKSTATKVKVTDCSFQDLAQAIVLQYDEVDPELIDISGNTFTDCSYALLASWDEDDAGVFSFTGNAATGSSELRSKVVLLGDDEADDEPDKDEDDDDHDVEDQDGVQVTVSGNTLANALIGTVDLEDTVNDVLKDNTFGESSFYVNAEDPEDAESVVYQAPAGETGYWILTDLETLDAGTAQTVQQLIDAANAAGDDTLTFTPAKFFAQYPDAVYFVSGEMPVSTVSQAESAESGAESAESATASAGTGAVAESTESKAESAESGAESTESQAESAESGAESTESQAESAASTAESATSTAESTEIQAQNLSETRDIAVTVVWKDSDNKKGARPDSVTVRLYANGEEYGAITLSARNSWSATFDDVAKNNTSGEIEYTLKQDHVKGYNTGIGGSAEKGFTVTNTISGLSIISPLTGDTTNLLLPIAVMVVAVIVIAGVFIFRRRKK